MSGRRDVYESEPARCNILRWRCVSALEGGSGGGEYCVQRAMSACGKGRGYGNCAAMPPWCAPLCRWAREHGLVFVPSIGPGYNGESLEWMCSMCSTCAHMATRLGYRYCHLLQRAVCHEAGWEFAPAARCDNTLSSRQDWYEVCARSTCQCKEPWTSNKSFTVA